MKETFTISKYVYIWRSDETGAQLDLYMEAQMSPKVCVGKRLIVRTIEPDAVEVDLGVVESGVSWAEGNLKHPKLSNVIICHAVHDICVHKNYSIPDLLRMNSYEVLVELKIQSFHDLRVNGSSSN